jgi:hypothetical protein
MTNKNGNYAIGTNISSLARQKSIIPKLKWKELNEAKVKKNL